MENHTETYTKTYSIDLERANYHLKLKDRKKKRILIVAIVWVLIFVYMITPLSRVNLKVNGNVYYSKQDLIDLSYLNENTLWWLLNEDNIIESLEAHDYIENVSIKKSVFGTKMTIKEIYPVGENNDTYIMNNSLIINKNDYSLNYKINNITDFSKIASSDIEEVSSKYSYVNLNVRNNINEIEVVKNSRDYKFIKLYGYDENVGYFIIKTDLVYLDSKFDNNKYTEIIEEMKKNNVKYSKDNPCLVAYHELDEEAFSIVDSFQEE